MGSADSAAAFTDSQALSYSLDGETKGAAALARIEAGSMPPGGVCTGDPAVDAGNAACLTAAELAVLTAWVNDGQLPPTAP
jgi:hypothetical protein